MPYAAGMLNRKPTHKPKHAKPDTPPETDAGLGKWLLGVLLGELVIRVFDPEIAALADLIRSLMRIP